MKVSQVRTLEETVTMKLGGKVCQEKTEVLYLADLDADGREHYIHGVCICINHEGIEEGRLPVAITQVATSLANGDVWLMVAGKDTGKVFGCARIRPAGMRVWVDTGKNDTEASELRRAIVSHVLALPRQSAS